MKKILSISVVALLAMAPTMGWAKEPAVATGQNTLKTAMQSQNITHATDATAKYITDRSTSSNYDLTATPTSGESYKHLGDEGVRPIVDPGNPKYNVEVIGENDGKKVAAVSYVKGAYNDLITKVNRVAEETSGGNITVYTTWGSTSDKKTVTLDNTTQGAE